MKEELMNNLTLFLDYVKQGTDFVVAQAPLYVQELIQYSLWVHIFYISIALFVILIGIATIFPVYKLISKDTDSFAAILIPIMLILVPMVPFVKEMRIIIQIYFAPRVFVMEYLLGLIK